MWERASNNRGTTGLAIQYVVAIIVAGAVIGVLVYVGINMERKYEIEMAIKEAKKIANIADIMYVTAEEGSVNNVKVKFPEGVKEIVYGSDNKDLSNRYFILMKWNEKRIFYSNASFCGHNNKYAILDGNCREITMSLVIKEGKRYVEIVER